MTVADDMGRLREESRRENARKLFDEVCDLLRAIEDEFVDGRHGGVPMGAIGRLVGMTRALDVLDAWPTVEDRKKYRPRIVSIGSWATKRSKC